MELAVRPPHAAACVNRTAYSGIAVDGYFGVIYLESVDVPGDCEMTAEEAVPYVCGV